jgi:hypothetical protein
MAHLAHGSLIKDMNDHLKFRSSAIGDHPLVVIAYRVNAGTTAG